MFILSDLYLVDTNQPVAYSEPGETIDVDRIANCNWWPRQEKKCFDVCPQVAWWCKMTHQPGGGGGDEPLEPPLDPPLQYTTYSI